MTIGSETGYLATAFRDADMDDHTQKVIDAISTQYTLPSFLAYKSAVQSQLNLEEGAAVLDVGSGLGYDAFAIADVVGPGGSCLGVDISAKLVAIARERIPERLSNVAFEIGSADCLDLADNSFDTVKIDRLLIHVEDPRKVLAEVYRVLKPGGQISVVEPDWGTLTLTSSDRVATRRFVDAWGDSFRRGWIGRQLPHLLTEVGFGGVGVGGHLVTMQGFAVVDQLLELTATAARLDGEDSDDLPSMQQGSQTPQQATRPLGSLGRWVASLQGATAATPVIATVTMFHATGVR